MKLLIVLPCIETALLFSQISAVLFVTEEWYHFKTGYANGVFSLLSGSSRIRASLNCNKDPDCNFFCEEEGGDFIQSKYFVKFDVVNCQDTSKDILHCWTNQPYIGEKGVKKEDGLYYILRHIYYLQSHEDAITCCRKRPKWRLAIMRSAQTFDVFKFYTRYSLRIRIGLETDKDTGEVHWIDGSPFDYNITELQYTSSRGNSFIMLRNNRNNIDDEDAGTKLSYLCQANHDNVNW